VIAEPPQYPRSPREPARGRPPGGELYKKRSRPRFFFGRTSGCLAIRFVGREGLETPDSGGETPECGNSGCGTLSRGVETVGGCRARSAVRGRPDGRRARCRGRRAA